MLNSLAELKNIVKEGDIQENIALSTLTTFRVGGPARFVVSPANEEELSGLIRYLRENRLDSFILGRGSNLLVSDKGYDGVIISLREHFQEIAADPETGLVRAGAGVQLSAVSAKALAAGLTGLEFASGIPGTMGGGLFMNAGAYGGELKNVIVSARAVTPEGSLVDIPAEELELGHRRSRFMRTGEVITSCTLRLSPGNPEEIKALMDDLNCRRREKQPLEYPSAGSTFKRPEGYFASKLIDDAGLKGFRVGGAMVSEKHAGFVINAGDATARDIYQLCGELKKRVLERFGVELELEVQLLGDFS